jgi:hypothetical protein
MQLVLAVCLALEMVGDDPPQRKPAPAMQAQSPAAHQADFKLVVWFHHDRPLETFKYQAYDVRKGEYTPKVDEWLELMRSKYRGYEVIVREVDLSREKGATELLKVGAVIKRELLAAAALQGVFVGEPGMTVTARPPSLQPGRRVSPDLLRGPAPLRRGMPGSLDLNPPAPSFPVPMPYSRPHP